jgi:hypothetical protein
MIDRKWEMRKKRTLMSTRKNMIYSTSLKVKNFEALNSKISALSGCLSEICNEK